MVTTTLVNDKKKANSLRLLALDNVHDKQLYLIHKDENCLQEIIACELLGFSYELAPYNINQLSLGLRKQKQSERNMILESKLKKFLDINYVYTPKQWINLKTYLLNHDQLKEDLNE